MSNQKTLTLNGLVLPNFIFLVLSIAMIFTGLYLTNHWFDTFYPSGISESSSLCNLSEFWGCDKATRSPLGSILGTPTSLFGIIMGIFGLMTAILGKRELEKTAKVIFTTNFILCLVLLVYSLIALGGLCPVCTIYYVLSTAVFFLFFKYSSLNYAIDPKFAGLFLGILIIPMIAANVYIGNKEGAIKKLSQSYISQFQSLKEYGDPAFESPFKVHQQIENFADAPIRISIFSDFQCPYCAEVSKIIPALISEFKDKIAIQYLFYPLDSSCNPKMKGSMHPYACYASYLAACDTNKFREVHDFIFDHQSEINFDNLKLWAKKFGLSEACFEDSKIKDQIQQIMGNGEQYQLQSTPTLIINGRKIEGLIPTPHLIPILKSLVK